MSTVGHTRACLQSGLDCDPSDQNRPHHNVKPGFAGVGTVRSGLAQPSLRATPAERPFHPPPFGPDDEALDSLGTLDHLQAYFPRAAPPPRSPERQDRKSTRLNSSHVAISYAVFCLKKKKNKKIKKKIKKKKKKRKQKKQKKKKK